MVASMSPRRPGSEPAEGLAAPAVQSVAVWTVRVLRVVSVVAPVVTVVLAAVAVVSVVLPLVAPGLVDPRGLVLTGPGILIATVLAALVWLIADQLRRVFETVRARDPFQRPNVHRLRRIALALAAIELARYLGAGLVALSVSVWGPPPGQSVAALASIDIGVWLGVAIVFVLAEVFREGSRLREEQELTV
jgi:hypothetical protein